MTIEVKLDRIIELLEARAGTSAPAADAAAPENKPAPRRGRPRADQTVAAATVDAAPTAPEAPAEPAAEDDFLSEEKPAVTYTKDDVRAALVAYQAVTDAPTARALMTKISGADKLSDIAIEKYTALVEAAKAATTAKKSAKK